MAYTFDELHKMTVAQLRDIAKDIQHDAVKGFSTMHKEKLVPAICDAMGIEKHLHHHVVGVDKVKMKADIRVLKMKRDEALKANDRKAFKEALKSIHRLKNKLRRATV